MMAENDIFLPNLGNYLRKIDLRKNKEVAYIYHACIRKEDMQSTRKVT